MLWETPEQIPAVIAPKRRREFRLAMAAEPPGGKLAIQVVVEKTAAAPRLGLSFNGAWPVYDSRETREMLFPVGPYTQFTEPHVAWEFTLDRAAIRHGWNSVTVMNNNPADGASVTVVSVELGVS
jgi:hypothetical protein